MIRRLAKDKRGVLTIELALILTVLVVPLALAVAKYEKPIETWVVSTSKNLAKNNDLQEQNNALLKELLAKQGQSGGGNTQTGGA